MVCFNLDPICLCFCVYLKIYFVKLKETLKINVSNLIYEYVQNTQTKNEKALKKTKNTPMETTISYARAYFPSKQPQSCMWELFVLHKINTFAQINFLFVEHPKYG